MRPLSAAPYRATRATLRDLRLIPLFASLDDTTLGDVASQIDRYEYRAGAFIVHEDEPPAGMFAVLAGRVRLSRTAPDGREQVLGLMSSGDIFNSVPMFDGMPNPASARAMSAVTCLVLPRAELLDLIGRHPDLGLALLRDMSGRLRELVVLVEDLAFRSVRERLARLLLREATEGDADLTQQELAERTGTVREIAGRALRQLAEEGMVRLARGRVTVLDRAALLRLIGDKDR